MLALLLVHADDQPLTLLAQVTLSGGIHDMGQFLATLIDLGNVVGDEILMLQGMERQIDPGHHADFARPQARRVDDMFGNDGALFCHNVPVIVRTLVQFQHPVAQIDLGPGHARGLGIGVRRAGGVEVPVQRIVERTQNALGIGDRADLGDLFGPDNLGRKTHMAVLGALSLEKIQPLGRIGNGQPTDMMQPAGHAGDFLKLAVEADGVALQRGHVGIGIERVEATCCMPGRAGRQFRAFDQNNIGPAALGQVIEDTAANDTTADHRDLHMRFHGSVRLDQPRTEKLEFSLISRLREKKPRSISRSMFLRRKWTGSLS